uniref:Uncharacterized protein n=1 Tax=Anguilla anguilla TaxID=7936 RepID=A0A0E9UBF0_ANGAN
MTLLRANHVTSVINMASCVSQTMCIVQHPHRGFLK